MTLPYPERPALFLDFDGTLVEIAPRPGDVVVEPGLKDTLKRLMERCEGAVAIVTGRKIEDIDRFVEMPLAAAGMHGLERRAEPGAEVETAPPPPEIDTLRQRLSAHPVISGGVQLEDKGAGLAVHYRAQPTRRAEVEAAVDEAMDGLHEALGLIHGKMVVEAKAKSHDKGGAVNSFMEHPPFAGRTPIFLGDDVTDEDGIRAVQEIDGHGIKVGDGESGAEHRIATVADVHAYLARLADGA